YTLFTSRCPALPILAPLFTTSTFVGDDKRDLNNLGVLSILCRLAMQRPLSSLAKADEDATETVVLMQVKVFTASGGYCRRLASPGAKLERQITPWLAEHPHELRQLLG